MLDFLKREANKAFTENGAVTYQTTQSDCLDFFATVGALRGESETEIMIRFDRAFAEDADIALKTLFYARDIRGGLGERRVFRTILRHMAGDRLDSVEKNLWAVPEFGRFDDLLPLLDTPAKQAVLDCISVQLYADINALNNDGSVSLLGKWLPSVNAHNTDTVRYGRMIAGALGLREAEYRKILTRLRARIAIIENNLRLRDYTFEYARQPSKAMYKYRQAFLRNDGERYNAFLSAVERGEATLHSGTLFPYEIIHPLFSDNRFFKITPDQRRSMNVTWNAQADFTDGENALVVVDGSGSMYWDRSPMPAEVALSLGIYFAERNQGRFAGHFITFSANPRLVKIKGRDIYEKVKYCASFNEVSNTDIQRVFELILSTAVKARLPQRELPDTIYIISDMEFDYCANGADVTNFTAAAQAFASHGYKLPKLVFWNVASRNQQQPVTMNKKGVTLVSGASPRVFDMITSGNLSPYRFMLDTLKNERYHRIIA